jgi:hypothetical protein
MPYNIDDEADGRECHVQNCRIVQLRLLRKTVLQGGLQGVFPSQAITPVPPNPPKVPENAYQRYCFRSTDEFRTDLGAGMSKSGPAAFS